MLTRNSLLVLSEWIFFFKMADDEICRQKQLSRLMALTIPTTPVGDISGFRFFLTTTTLSLVLYSCK